jgi:hypothetical protein
MERIEGSVDLILGVDPQVEFILSSPDMTGLTVQALVGFWLE